MMRYLFSFHHFEIRYTDRNIILIQKIECIMEACDGQRLIRLGQIVSFSFMTVLSEKMFVFLLVNNLSSV